AHAEAVRARDVSHGAAVERGTVERDPCRDGVALANWPVALVLVRVGQPTSRLLVERLVVPQPQRRHAEQRRRRAGDSLVEGEQSYAGVVLPEIDALLEGLLVAALLGERPAIPRRAGRHGGVHCGAETGELFR